MAASVLPATASARRRASVKDASPTSSAPRSWSQPPSGYTYAPPKGLRRSLRDIARELAAMGYTNRNGTPYSASCVKSMVEGPSP
jgi:hypothetical protein